MIFAARNMKPGGHFGESTTMQDTIQASPNEEEAKHGSIYDLDGGFWSDSSGSDISEDEKR